DRADLPFTLLYLIDQPGKRARLASGSGHDALDAEPALAPPVIPLASADERDETPVVGGVAYAVARVARTGQRESASLARQEASDAASRAGDALRPHTAMVLPIIEPGQAAPSAVLLAGVSPQRALDDDYIGFYELLVSHLSAGLAAANAYEEERRRAEALADLDRAKTTFFSNVSHEFRTPLSLLLGPLEDLRERQGGLTPAARDQLDVMYRNGLRLLKLVNTLLDFSRIEAGRVLAAYEPTDLTAYTAELASAFRSLMERAGLTLDVECPPLSGLLAPVYIDREMWEKIVLNLLSNAFKYTFAGTVSVTLRSVDAGGAVELEVRDTGVGIPASELPRLFERFHRVEGARARTHEGSGIGLSLVQGLVQLHGGAIWIESVEGAGTSVFVRLPTGSAHLPVERVHTNATFVSTALGTAPYVQEAERWLPDGASSSETLAPPALAEMAPTAPTAPANGHAARIVLADDNADMRGYLRRLLSERYQVEAVGNGAAALAAIHRQPPDLVLTDVMMPELDGLGLLAALRSDPRTRAIPVIVLSARAGAEASVEGLRAGADDYLVKPFSAREVLSRVEARLEMARLRNEAEARARELESVFDAITDAAFVYDRDGRIVRMNAAAQTLFDLDNPTEYAAYPPEQRSQLISPRDEYGQAIPVEQSGLHRLLRGESLTGANAVDVRLRLADGRTLDVNITGAPLRGPTGEITGAVAISRDVTERRRLEQDIRFQASMLERAHDATFMWELDGPISYWNRGAELLYGFTRDEAVGQVSHHLLRTKHGVPVKEFEAAIERNGEWTGELIHTTRDGRQVTVLSRQQLLREPDGRRYVLETSRDVTEQRRLEREVRASEARLRAIVELLPVGVAVVDASGKAQIVNQALKAIWGEDVP
ncbi:MAG TPA: PAS domain S-box protein, partial [Ktedonobacterales bacterium]|nr:PAS domain S-box protein [Ktedonobacterales bacterium]